METTSYSLINSVLHNKPLKHPNPKVMKGFYEFVRFNLDDGTVALDNLKTGERVDVSKNIFYSMETPITESFLDAIINGASRNYEKPSKFKLIHVLDKESGDVMFNQVKPEEIGFKYTLVKGKDNLYELSQPKFTELDKDSNLSPYPEKKDRSFHLDSLEKY